MRRIKSLFKHAFLILFSLICIFPFYWMIVSATNVSKDITMGKLTFGNALLANVRNAFQNADILRAFMNSAFLAIVITVLSLLICSIAGYAFVIFPGKVKNILFLALIASMMVPFAAKIIPMFRMFSNLGLLNSFSSIILPAIGTPFLIFFFKQNTHAFPLETIQAARVDGLGEYGIFFRIYMPMMKSTYAAAGIFAFMASWNNYMWPLIALQSTDKFSLPLAVSNLAAGFTPDYGMVMVGIIISTLPTVLVFFLLQKAFVEGMVGSVK
ncbi:MAG TPA: carbohydrate ABC transporter permease [Candidatus Mediterraneibacter excrementigallinarum]|nr:carbohydrate ABC transporter permease [Candidatus Mediterraneibacter excrementigallinarum]